jgi:hypothetical protein
MKQTGLDLGPSARIKRQKCPFEINISWDSGTSTTNLARCFDYNRTLYEIQLSPQFIASYTSDFNPLWKQKGNNENETRNKS